MKPVAHSSQAGKERGVRKIAKLSGPVESLGGNAGRQHSQIIIIIIIIIITMINLKNTRQPLKDMFRHNLCHLQFNENNQNSAIFIGDIDNMLS